MSSTSRVLRPDEHSAITPIWWRDTELARVGEQSKPSRETQPAQETQKSSAPLPEIDREKIEREAYERGFSEGKALGKEQAKAEVQPVLERLSRCLAELSSLRPRMRREAEKDLVKLSIAIARRVLHRELTLDPESMESLIRVALDRLEARELSRVRIHPDQEAVIRALLERFSNSRNVEVIPDKSLQLGDVVLETAHGTVDASVDAQLREIERGFADRLQR